LAGFKALQELNISGTFVTDEGVEALQKTVPLLKVVRNK